MLNKFIRIIGGDPNKKLLDRYISVVDQINALEAQFEALSDEALAAKTEEFRALIAERTRGLDDPADLRSAEREALDEILPQAFAAVREASKRAIGLRHFDVQLIGGMTLHQGKIAEMRTGEGKTLVATLPMYLNALPGRGVHLITVNDYLARRDARWMGPIFMALGMSVGVLQIAARTENGKKAFIVDLEHTSPHEDQHQLRMVMRSEAYQADILYGTNSEFGFDYLRDNMTYRWEDRVQHGHYYAIVDEVDNVLIDEARTPLIISGPAQDESQWYNQMAQVVKALRPEDYEISEKDRNVTLTEVGEAHVEELIGAPLRDPERPEDLTPEQARMLGYLEQALRAQFLYKRNKEYLVQSGKVVIVDEFTGRLMPGRRWSEGLHQAVEAKEGVRVENESVTYATITIQNYFRMYDKLAGMSGTAITEAEEFSKIYDLDVLAIPTNLEYQAMRADTDLVELEAKDEQGYKYRYYARKDERQPIFWKRKDYPDIVYRTEDAKLRAIVWEIMCYHAQGRPVLVGTTSVELSERLSSRLKAEPLRRLSQVMLLRRAWMVKHQREEDGRQIPELQFMYQPLDKLDVGEMRRLARDLDISFNPEDPANLEILLALLDLGAEQRTRLVADLQGGIPHEVLNARKHTEESQIIAGAGAFGAVTIATNMAGRGVDIKLGGDLAEEVIVAVNRVLSRNGFSNPYDMQLEERRKAILSLPASAYGIYEAEISYFLRYMDEMELVRSLGGLHVIGSERHEARRIDNQLRGRSARQGDPGSSRFYLSMEDDLMRLFGGQNADNLMQRLKVDEAIPIEFGLVGRIVEGSQTRVEGMNFDMRKHLLEYDDVLNTQRAAIYSQRNRIFLKSDMSEDVTEMLRSEVMKRVPEALKDDGGPWKLLLWLEQIQPPLSAFGFVFPSYTYRLLLEDLKTRLPEKADGQTARQVLVDLARRALEAELEHHLHSLQSLIDQAEKQLEEQLDDRIEGVKLFFEALEEAEGPRRPVEIQNELSNSLRVPLKLSAEALRGLPDDPDQAETEARQQVEEVVINQSLARLLGAVERRLDEELDLPVSQLADLKWQEIARRIHQAVEALFARRIERYLGAEGQITRELENVFSRWQGVLDEQKQLALLMMMPQGSRSMFDKRTHRRVFQRTSRLVYTYLAARELDNRRPEDVAEAVLDHLEKAQQAMFQAWGLAEFARLGNATLSNFDEDFTNAVLDQASEVTDKTLSTPLVNMPSGLKLVVVRQLGQRVLTEMYRQVLIGVITELWVDYLTQMEALRVSIGLEAYGQRDPLVMYKNKAYELFQQLLSDMRLGVVNRMFTVRPREASAVQTGSAAGEASDQPASDSKVELELEAGGDEEAAETQNQLPSRETGSTGKKKRRRRR